MTRSKISIITGIFVGFFVAAAIGPTPVQAGPAFYVDAGGSLVHIHEPAPFYGDGASSAGLGYGLNIGAFTTFTERSPVVNLQFGIEDRYSSASGSLPTDTYQLMAVYPVLRLQLSRLFFSFGYSPFVMRGGTFDGSSNSLSKVSGATSALGEAGTLFPITPKFSFGGSVSGEWVNSNSAWSPRPVMAGNLFMRFYFGFGEGGGSTTSTEFRGWRYPFGRDL